MMNTKLTDLLAKIRDARVLVVGDIMLDEFVEGHIDRISPEAPVPVLVPDSIRYMPGGAANVANNVVALGGAAVLVGVVGCDRAGERLERILNGINGLAAHCFASVSVRTTHKTRYGASGQHVLRIDDEIISPISGDFYDGIIRAVRNALPNCQAMVLSDYGKGMFNSRKGDDALSSHLIPLATGMRVPVFVDTKSVLLDWFCGADVLKPNLAELALMSGMPVGTPVEVAVAAHRLRATYDFESVVVTCGAEGAMLVTEDSEFYVEGSHRAVCDVSGAGDTFMAGMAVARASGLDMAGSADFGGVVASISVGKVGTAVVTPAEVLDEVGQPQAYDEADPAIDSMLDVWRADNLRIAFTNGAFDLLHVDHIDFLRRCVGFGDRLVVGLNSDDSVRRQKGEGRPVVPVEQRATMLLALDYVDMVVIFDDETPRRLIEHVRPHVLVKDSGYTEDEIAGSEFLEQWGGELQIIPRGTRTSTTEIVGRMDPEVQENLAASINYKREAVVPVNPFPYARAWLDEVMEWWRVNAWDKKKGGFHEGLKFDEKGVLTPLTDAKRTMVQARQVAVFSNWETSLDVQGWQYLKDQAVDIPDFGTAFPHSPLDGKRTLYDHAFVLLACAEHAKTGVKQPLEVAERVIHYLDTVMKADEGYWSEISTATVIDRQRRHSDPHMHLLEAFIALHRVAPDRGWLERACTIANLAMDRFIKDGVLYEKFHHDWSVVGGTDDGIVSPGHHFEWVTLLIQMVRLSGMPAYADAARTLYQTALESTDPETSAVPLYAKPAVGGERRRLWPQCEALRATQMMVEEWPQDDVMLPALRDKLLAMILRDHAVGFVWHEYLQPDGLPIDGGTVPASSLYHLFFCLDYVLKAKENADA